MAAVSRTVLVTGSTDGVGRRVAERLAQTGTTVLVHGRDRARGAQTLAAIRTAGGTGMFYPADLSSLSEVRRLAEAVQHDHRRLDVLINNAGIGFGEPGAIRQLSQDGYELRFAVNYLSGFLLTRLLLPLLEATGSSRIINVASAGQEPIDFTDVMLTRNYTGVRAYRQSKLAQIMFTFDLAEDHEASRTVATCLHPATFMDTTMVRSAGIAPVSTVDEGADAILHLAESAEMAARTGLYFDGLRPSRAHSQAYDRAARQRLRALSFQLVGLPQP